MKIAMVGTGYVGLVSAACFSEFGMEVVCVDKDADKIEALREGRIPIYEPGLEDLVETNRSAGRLSFTTDLADAVKGARAIFIAVGTPANPRDGSADLSSLYDAARDIAPLLASPAVVVVKSTVPVGSGRRLAAVIRECNPAADFDVASNPEFLREGAAINDFMRPDRVVIGIESDRARAVLRAVYRPLYLIETPIVFTNLETAELTKHAANAFLATKITFINEVADLCDKVGADVHDLARGIGLDGRIGRKFLHPGPGFGGSCFPKDTRALVHAAQQAESPIHLVETVVAVNEARKQAMARRIIDHCGGDIAGWEIAVLGLTFKPNTDDMREAPSLDILPVLQAAGARIRAYDPAGMENARALLPGVAFSPSAEAAMAGADALVVLTEWNLFRAMDATTVASALRRPNVIDLRNIFDPATMAAAGIHYLGIGRPKVAVD